MDKLEDCVLFQKYNALLTNIQIDIIIVQIAYFAP